MGSTCLNGKGLFCEFFGICVPLVLIGGMTYCSPTRVWKVDNISVWTIYSWNLWRIVRGGEWSGPNWLSDDSQVQDRSGGWGEMYKNVTINTRKMAIHPTARHRHRAADDAIIMAYINTQRSTSKYTITACRAKVKFSFSLDVGRIMQLSFIRCFNGTFAVNIFS